MQIMRRMEKRGLGASLISYHIKVTVYLCLQKTPLVCLTWEVWGWKGTWSSSCSVVFNLLFWLFWNPFLKFHKWRNIKQIEAKQLDRNRGRESTVSLIPPFPFLLIWEISESLGTEAGKVSVRIISTTPAGLAQQLSGQWLLSRNLHGTEIKDSTNGDWEDMSYVSLVVGMGTESVGDD